MKLLILHGPNLNLLGLRQPDIYGIRRFEDYLPELKNAFPEVELEYFQSNHEGVLIDQLHQIGWEMQGILFNAGAYTHTSLALADAISAIPAPVLEIHISNVQAREPIRHHSMIASACVGSITGLGFDSYRLGIQYFIWNQGAR